MALPTPDKTWQYSINNTVVGVSLNWNVQIWTTINAMVTFPISPWVVLYSCDSITAGTAGDGINRWVTSGNLIWGTGASGRSWIVLKQAGIAPNFQIMISLNASNKNVFAFRISPSAGFTGGTFNTEPTATDQVICGNSGGQPGTQVAIDVIGSNVNHVIDVLLSTDGACTYIFWLTGGFVTSSITISKPKNPTTGWTIPWVVTVEDTNSTTDCWTLGGNLNPFGLNGTVIMAHNNYFTSGNSASLFTSGSVTVEGGISNLPLAQDFTVANGVSGTWDLYPLGLQATTPGMRGRHGMMFDMWGISTGVTTGDTLPNDLTRQFVVFGTIIVPWNGSVPATS